ncbi:MAG: hypothetical protein ACRCS8_02040 [Brevinema sp.]
MIYLIQKQLSQLIVKTFNFEEGSIFLHPLNDKEYFATPYLCIVPGQGSSVNDFHNPQYLNNQKFQQKFFITQPITLTLTDTSYEATTDFVTKFLSVVPRYLEIDRTLVSLTPKTIDYRHSTGELDLFSVEIVLEIHYHIFSATHSVPKIKEIELETSYKEGRDGQ